ncbi:hypothetical protein B0J12DRAFT_318586 [Macrophomina phaseolina]|uniref:Uncharacterized protein n=1 Tax=Macrophomina phaseolina TaxID=35725 RepID=A0ABQ8FWC8_9PEZI|nr:hypothetical protein B0J12DRAFT_318586 [Macrophomina phaseolina]
MQPSPPLRNEIAANQRIRWRRCRRALHAVCEPRGRGRPPISRHELESAGSLGICKSAVVAASREPLPGDGGAETGHGHCAAGAFVRIASSAFCSRFCVAPGTRSVLGGLSASLPGHPSSPPHCTPKPPPLPGPRLGRERGRIPSPPESGGTAACQTPPNAPLHTLRWRGPTSPLFAHQTPIHAVPAASALCGCVLSFAAAMLPLAGRARSGAAHKSQWREQGNAHSPRATGPRPAVTAVSKKSASPASNVSLLPSPTSPRPIQKNFPNLPWHFAQAAFGNRGRAKEGSCVDQDLSSGVQANARLR